MVLAPPGAAGREGSKPSEDLGQSREKERGFAQPEQSLQGPLWLCLEPGEGGISPSEQLMLQEPDPWKNSFLKSVSVLASQPIPACPRASPLVSRNALEIPGTWSLGRGSWEFFVCLGPEEEEAAG